MKRIVVAASILIVQIGLGLLIAEAGIRLLKPGLIHRPDPIRHTFWKHDPELGWFNVIGDAGLFTKPEFSHRVTTNSMGFRDRERRPDRTGEPRGGQGRLRIAVFGDSTTWGHGVEDDQVYTRLLEDRLPGVEVWNLGVAAYATDQELLLFRRVVSEIHPDLVLLMIDRNDFEGDVATCASVYAKPWFEEDGPDLRLAGVPVPTFSRFERAWTDLRRRSVVVYSLWYLLGGRWPDTPREGPEGQIRMMRRLLDQFQREVSDHGARFAVGLVPSIVHVYSEDIPKVEADRLEAVRIWGRERGVHVFDLVPVFRQAFASIGAWYHYRLDSHWNSTGHRLAAKALAALLRESGLVPGSP